MVKLRIYWRNYGSILKRVELLMNQDFALVYCSGVILQSAIQSIWESDYVVLA